MPEMTAAEMAERSKPKKLGPKKIVYRIDHTFERAPVPLFSEFEDHWEFVNEKGQPVIVGKDNIQEQIQSYEDCALDKILDKYLKEDNVEEVAKAISSPGVERDNENIYEHVSPDLADLGEEYERVEQLKEFYNLDPALSYEDTLVTLQKRKAALDAQIIKLQSKEKEENEKTQDDKESE